MYCYFGTNFLETIIIQNCNKQDSGYIHNKCTSCSSECSHEWSHKPVSRGQSSRRTKIITAWLYYLTRDVPQSSIFNCNLFMEITDVSLFTVMLLDVPSRSLFGCPRFINYKSQCILIVFTIYNTCVLVSFSPAFRIYSIVY